MQRLTNHEKKILELVKKHPEIIKNRDKRIEIAEKNGLSEKTLRNRIGDLKKYGYIGQDVTAGMTESNFSTYTHSDEINLLDYGRIIWKWKKFIIINVCVMSFLAVVISLLMPKTYKSSAVLMPPASESGMGILGTLSELSMGGFLSKSGDETMSFIAILKSRTVMENVIDKFDLVNFYEVDYVEEAIESLQDNVSFELEEEGTIRISALVATGWFHPEKEEEISKKLSPDIANYFVEQLDIVNKGLKTQQASFQRIFIGERYKQNIVDLKNAEETLKIFQEKHKLVSLPDQTAAAIEAAAGIKAQIITDEVNLEVLKEIRSFNHPDIKSLEKEIGELQLQLKEMDFGSLDGKEDGNQLFPIFSEVPELGMQLLRLMRGVRTQNTLFIFLTQQFEEAKLQEAKDTPTVQVLDEAKIPIKKYRPRRALLVVSTFLLMLIINIIFVTVKTNYNEINI
jgi:uncharacterized protein involved in exopolysaccharide biosynthesis